MSNDITIKVNGQDEPCPEGLSIQDYLAARGVEAAQVVAEHNGAILKPEAFASTTLKDGDNIEFIRFVGGG